MGVWWETQRGVDEGRAGTCYEQKRVALAVVDALPVGRDHMDPPFTQRREIGDQNTLITAALIATPNMVGKLAEGQNT